MSVVIYKQEHSPKKAWLSITEYFIFLVIFINNDIELFFKKFMYVKYKLHFK